MMRDNGSMHTQKTLIATSTMGILLVLTGCASNGGLKDQYQLLESRVSDLESQLNKQKRLEEAQGFGQLNEKVRQIQGSIEELDHRVDNIQSKQRDLYINLDQRLRAVETPSALARNAPLTPPAAPGATQPPGQQQPPGQRGLPVSTPPQAPVGAIMDNSANAEQAYQQALNLLQRGRYPEAATALEQFIATYPGSPYAANATYWLGETYYVSRQYDKARSAFQTVIQRYPQSDKVADAWLKVGFVHYELQQWQNARQALQRVLANYPGTNAAQLAHARLKKMQEDGVLH